MGNFQKHTKTRSFNERRKFLVAGLAASLPPISLHANFETYPDVVIVGAGAAGIAAAKNLKRNNIKTVILEASDRVGGRVYTDLFTFGIPYDVGAHWLHNGKNNPFHQIAEQVGFNLYLAPDEMRIFTTEGEASESERNDYFNAEREVYMRIARAGKSGKDIPASDAVGNIRSMWGDTAKFVVGPWEMGKNLDQFSTLDWWNSAENIADYYCSRGFGTLVAEHAKDLHPSLNTIVKRIDWSGQNIRIDTNKGTLHPRIVILTVSTGVLASNAIKFVPSLPLQKRESFEAISMGFYDHIALQFSEDVFGMENDGYLIHQVGKDGRGFGVLTNISGTGLAYCDVGGDWARQLQSETVQYRVDYALTSLREMLGNNIVEKFVKGTATSWGMDPLFFGSYASAKPGAYSMRQVLREPVGERIYFAGEACHRSMWATVGGAHLSGEEVAKIVSRVVA